MRAILVDWLVQTANEVSEKDEKTILKNLDYRYYISEVQKQIAEIEVNKNQLTLF